MIPLHLTLSGFLSYRDLVELDFSAFDLACISGANGAGKSSLLDAITWALFGKARKNDSSLINNHPAVKAAFVALVFAYEGNIYRVQRTLPRGKNTLLEFQIMQDDGLQAMLEAGQNSDAGLHSLSHALPSEVKWKSLSERKMSETQANIESTLRMDYDTFTNASFFLQGKADQFTKESSAKRKAILSTILGLEDWEIYRQRAGESRKRLETDIASLEGRMHEIDAELAEETERKSRLTRIQEELERLSTMRARQESVVQEIKKISATLEEQRKLVEALTRQVDASSQNMNDMQNRLTSRLEERTALSLSIARAAQILEDYTSWQTARLELEACEQSAQKFRDQEKLRHEPLDEINAERARLSQEQQMLLEQENQVKTANSEITLLQQQVEFRNTQISEAHGLLAQRDRLQSELNNTIQRQADANAENSRFKSEMEILKTRIERLKETEGATCPVCGQPLDPDDRLRLIEELETKGKEMGNQFRANQTLQQETGQLVSDLERQITSLKTVESVLLEHTRNLEATQAKLDQMNKLITEWENDRLPRLREITNSLQEETFCPAARLRLAAMDEELIKIGYDAAAHDVMRNKETNLRFAEAEYLNLQKAKATLLPLEREIADLETQINRMETEIERQKEEYANAQSGLQAAQAQAPDLRAAERELLDMQEQENRLRLDVGAAQQKVQILEDLKHRRKSYEEDREQAARHIGQYKQLERAFGKDGVPALLIEQALPQIETKANEILDRLSGGNMSVRFVTQAAYKDAKREDLKETLDIQISDSAGTRDYEMFSGGEAFRVNFAIRLALSEVLAQRAGARLQTLVIDEGFGSQDTQGRQRLIEAINLVKQDFAKILVITHIDELKDAFPTRIEVEKNEGGSTIRVM